MITYFQEKVKGDKKALCFVNMGYRGLNTLAPVPGFRRYRKKFD